MAKPALAAPVDDAPVRRPRGLARPGPRRVVLQLVGIVTVFVLLMLFAEYGLQHLGVKSYVVPKPSRVWEAFEQNWSEVLAPALWVTAREVIFGLLLGVALGIVLAVLIDTVAYLEFVLLPYVVALVMTPAIAVVPIVYLQFENSLLVRILIVAMAAAPMTLLSTMTGLRRTPRIRLELMQAMRASRIQTLYRVKLPSALPAIFTGALISAIFAVVAAVGAEFVGGQDGLGAKIVYYSSLAQTSVVFACIALLVVLGLSLYAAITIAQRRFTGWEE